MHLRDRLSSVTRKKNDDDVVFVKQVPIHPRDRLARATRKKNDDDIAFVKQVPMYPRDRLAMATRKKKKMMMTSCFLNKYPCILGTD